MLFKTRNKSFPCYCKDDLEVALLGILKVMSRSVTRIREQRLQQKTQHETRALLMTNINLMIMILDKQNDFSTECKSTIYV